MAEQPSKEFREFSDLTRELLKVSKSALNKRLAGHREKVALNDSRPGPKRKPKPAHPIAPHGRPSRRKSR